MNNNQIKDIKNRIESFNQLKIDEILSSVFQNQDIQNLRIGQYTVPEYKSILKRLFKQLNNEINENGVYLPFQYNFQNEFGSGTLDNDIQYIVNLVNSRNLNNLNNSIAFVNRLIYYQLINGFWDKSTRKIHKHNEIKINELQEQLEFTGKQLNLNSQELRKQITLLQTEKENLGNFINQKHQELQQIKINLQTSNTESSQISQLLNVSTSTNEKINSILSQQNQNLETTRKKVEQENQAFENQKSIFKDQEKTISENIEILEGQISSFNEKLEFVESKKEYFEERVNYLNELIGREVGASLFETFKQRKGELEKPVNKWLWIVIISSALTFAAILVIFTNAFGYFGDVPTDISTGRLITNSIKSLPFFFLLFYSIAQYNKERNFQEEYAFKSAVALTIKAYSDIVVREDLKDELIVSSVTGVYKSPTIYKTKKTKEDTSIVDTAKELLSTAIDILKKK